MAAVRDEKLNDELFKSMDVNNDGSIDVGELKAELDRHNIFVSEEVVRKVISKFDLNKDGKLQVLVPTSPSTFAIPGSARLRLFVL